jgi:hypothetical protein
LQETVLKMGKPQKKPVEALKLWLDGLSEGPNGRIAPSFQGLSANRLDDERDLVALHPEFDTDWLTRLVEVPHLRHLFLVRPRSHLQKKGRTPSSKMTMSRIPMWTNPLPSTQ